MKKAFVLSVLFIAALSACQKTSDTLNQPTTYRVDGITDIVMAGDSGSAAYVNYSVNYVGPVQETVTLSFGDLPKGIMIDTSAQNVLTGIPNYTGMIHLIKTDTNQRKGTYVIKLLCNGSRTGAKFYTLNLKVLSKTIIPISSVCDTPLTGTWDTCTDLCSGTTYTDVVSLDATVVNRIHFTNFQNAGIDVYADLNCSNGTFVIPRQTFAGGAAAVWGSGSFASKLLAMSVTDSSGVAGIQTCAVSMTRP